MVSRRVCQLGSDYDRALQIIEVSLRTDSEVALSRWLVDVISETVDALREIVNGSLSEMTRIAVVVLDCVTPDPLVEALAEGIREALRGVVGSLTLELEGSVRLNLVLADEMQIAAVSEAVTFLAGEGSQFVAGSTMDLRQT